MDTDGIDYCAFTLSIVLVWHPLNAPTRGGQWSPGVLSAAMKQMQYGTEGNFVVNPLALHQSFHLFKKTIRSLGHELVQMGGQRNVAMIVEFMELPEVFNGWDIKFAVIDRTYTELNEIEFKIQEMAARIVKRYCGRCLHFKSLTELGASIFQRQLPVARFVHEEPGPSSVSKRRKTSSELGEKQMSNHGKSIVNMIVEKICILDEPATPYLIAAMKTRSLSSLNSISKSLFGRDYSEDLSLMLQHFTDDTRVKESLQLLPKRNIIFEDAEKQHVNRIYHVINMIMKELPDDHEIHKNYDAFEVTKKVLEKYPIYSELTESHIERWCQTRDNVKKKPGRKINSEFEAAIWGKLMICEYENVKVCNICYFILI